jgi:hypothetical protein
LKCEALFVAPVGIERHDEAPMHAAQRLAFFAARSGGRFVRISALLRCEGICGSSPIASAMTVTPPDSTSDFHALIFTFAMRGGAVP